MFEFKMDDNGYWLETEARLFSNIPTLTGYKLRFNETVYTEHNKEFIKAFEQYLIMELLSDRS